MEGKNLELLTSPTNGGFTELISKELLYWAKSRGIEIIHIQPGKPTQNAYIERFNGTYRREVLNAYWFNDLNQVKKITQSWLSEYNRERPHASLQYLTPRKYLENYYQEVSDYQLD